MISSTARAITHLPVTAVRRLALGFALTVPAAGQAQVPAVPTKPMVIVNRFNVPTPDSTPRAVADRLGAALSRALAADTSLRLVRADPRHPARPLGVTYVINAGALPKPDGTLRLDWELKSMETNTLAARDSDTVSPSRERAVVARIAAKVSAVLRARHQGG